MSHRQAIIDHTRRILDIMEAHPELPLPHWVIAPESIAYIIANTADDMRAAAAVLRASDPKVVQDQDRSHVNLRGTIDGVRVVYFADHKALAAPVAPAPTPNFLASEPVGATV